MPAHLNLLSIGYWPLWVGCGLLAVAAVVNHQLGRVPNVVSLPALGAAWCTALVVTGPGNAPSFGGWIGSSFLCSMVALAILLKAYHLGLGAGCVKMQMAFAAWVGCGLECRPAAVVTVIATAIGVAFTLIGIYLQYWRQRQANSDAQLWGQQPPQSSPLFPAQLTLSLGSILGLVLLFVPFPAR